MKRWTPPLLALVVGASLVVRTLVARLRAAPALFPDEYTYAAIGRSIAASGRPLIRGTSPHFPALLEPILTAPAWLVGDVNVSFRIVQAIGALAMSLAAVPVYLLARHLRLSAGMALGLSALALLVPDLVYSSFVSSEALAYPLFLAAAYAGVRALTMPSRRAHLGFLAATALATLARIQFGVLAVVFVVAAAAVGLRERRLREALREQALALLALGLVAAAILALGLGRALGTYKGALGLHVNPGGVVHWAALDTMTLAYAAGWVIVPGALLGFWLAVAKPASRAELAFGVTSLLLVVALLLEAGVLQASLPPQEIQERYVFYAVPLIGVAFALYASRGWPLRVPHLALAAALVLVSVRLPLTTYSIAATVDASPVLYGVYWLTGQLGKPGNAALVVAAAAGLMSALAVLASRRPRLGTPLVLGLAVLATGAASAGAVAFDVTNTRLAKKLFLPADPSWVDRAHVGSAALLQTWGGSRAPSLQELFWNRSIHRVLLLPDARSIDRFGDERVRIGRDGSLLDRGLPLRAPLVVDSFGSAIRLRGARLVARGPTAALWVPTGRPQLALYATGSYYDGWLADRGAVYLWASRSGAMLAGRLELRLTSPAEVGPARLTFGYPSGHIAVRLRPESPRRVSIPVCAAARAQVTYRSNVHGVVGLRFVSVRASVPVFRPDPSACPAAKRLR